MCQAGVVCGGWADGAELHAQGHRGAQAQEDRVHAAGVPAEVRLLHRLPLAARLGRPASDAAAPHHKAGEALSARIQSVLHTPEKSCVVPLRAAGIRTVQHLAWQKQSSAVSPYSPRSACEAKLLDSCCGCGFPSVHHRICVS